MKIRTAGAPLARSQLSEILSCRLTPQPFEVTIKGQRTTVTADEPWIAAESAAKSLWESGQLAAVAGEILEVWVGVAGLPPTRYTIQLRMAFDVV